MLPEAKFLMLNTYFCDKNGLLALNFGYVAKIQYLILSTLFPANINLKFSVGLHIETESARSMNM